MQVCGSVVLRRHDDSCTQAGYLGFITIQRRPARGYHHNSQEIMHSLNAAAYELLLLSRLKQPYERKPVAAKQR